MRVLLLPLESWLLLVIQALDQYDAIRNEILRVTQNLVSNCIMLIHSISNHLYRLVGAIIYATHVALVYLCMGFLNLDSFVSFLRLRTSQRSKLYSSRDIHSFSNFTL